MHTTLAHSPSHTTTSTHINPMTPRMVNAHAPGHVRSQQRRSPYQKQQDLPRKQAPSFELFASPPLPDARRPLTPDKSRLVPSRASTPTTAFPGSQTPVSAASKLLSQNHKSSPRRTTKLGSVQTISTPQTPVHSQPQTPVNKRLMHEEPIDRSREYWMDRKRRLDHQDAQRRDEMDSRYDGSSSRRSPGRSLGPPPPASGASRNGYSPRTQLPSINNLTSGSEDHLSRDEADATIKRRRLGEGHDNDDWRSDNLPTPPGHGSNARSPLHRRADLGPAPPGSGSRYSDERDGHLDDSHSSHDAHFPPRNGRVSPLEDRGRPIRSSGSGMPSLLPVHDYCRPSVLTAGPEDGFEHNSSIPGLARRRGDAAQAKASRLHIDTGSGTASSFDHHTNMAPSRSGGIAKSAPPQKLTFSGEGMEPPLGYSPRRDVSARFGPQLGSGYPSSHLAAPGQREQRAISGSRLHEVDPLSRKESREDLLSREMPHTANPLARQPARGGYVPQTATLPSPAYHTTQFARRHNNPPPTARLPDHLRSPPFSKAHFLSLFSDFYESLHDSRTLKATLEDQIKRSNTLLQTLQSSRRVLEETVERRVREERVLWEGRVRGLEARVRELEAGKTAQGPSSSSHSKSHSPEANAAEEEEAGDVDQLRDSSEAP